MGDFEKKCRILQNDVLGRFVTAAVPIKAGERVLFEWPAAVLPQMGERRCANCWKLAHTFCKKCQLAALCRRCRDHSPFDCHFLAERKSKVNVKLLQQHFGDLQGLLVCLLMRENVETRSVYEKCLELETHAEERRRETVWLELRKTVIGPLMKSCLLEQLTNASELNEEYLQRVLSVIDVNAFELRAPDEGALRGMYLRGLLLSHSCCPNCTVAIDDEHNMIMYANRDIAVGEIMNHCYTHPLLGTAERREMLRVGKYFHCSCARCEDPTEMGSHMSTLLCLPCMARQECGLVLRGLQEGDSWTCQRCGHLMPAAEVAGIVEHAKADILLAHGDLAGYERLLRSLAQRLHSNHFLLIDVKQNIAAMLREIIANALPPSIVGPKVFERKIELCEDILAVLDRIQPDISRLRGIAQYEIATAQLQLLRLTFTTKGMDTRSYQIDCIALEGKLRAALRMLIYEPPQTPEGRLARNALGELQALQREIKNFGEM